MTILSIGCAVYFMMVLYHFVAVFIASFVFSRLLFNLPLLFRLSAVSLGDFINTSLCQTLIILGKS